MLDQASCIFITGGKQNIIRGNLFKGHRNFISPYMLTFAWDIYHHMPDDYFEKSHAPLIFVDVGTNVFAEQFIDNYTDSSLATRIVNNTFYDNENYQLETFKSAKYKGSLLIFNCDITKATLEFSENDVQDMAFIGDDSVLIHINGGITEFNNNLFRYIGHFSSESISNSLDEVPVSHSKVYMPYEDYSFYRRQQCGCIKFDFTNYDLPKGYAHAIKNNVFEGIFSELGAAVCIFGSQI